MVNNVTNTLCSSRWVSNGAAVYCLIGNCLTFDQG
jgi:hypothetical protein